MEIEEKRYNPYHDPMNGRFTTSNGVFGGGGSVTVFVGKGQKDNKSYIVDDGFGRKYKFDTDTYNKINGLEVERKYANEMVKKFGTAKYGGTLKTRELFQTWNNEAKRLSNQLSDIYSKNAYQRAEPNEHG